MDQVTEDRFRSLWIGTTLLSFNAVGMPSNSIPVSQHSINWMLTPLPPPPTDDTKLNRTI